MYLSRLAAEKEFAFMKALRDEGFLVPEPISQSRHTILMDLIDAFPLRQISQVPDPATLYAELIAVILRLAKHGLIHGDFNEFNILLKEERAETATGSHEDVKVTVTPIIIDFPQMISMDHANAEMYFDRDVACIKRFFERRFHFVATEPGPFYKDAKKTVGRDGATRLDATVAASGFTKKMLKDLEAAIREQQEGRGEQGEDGEGGSDEDDEDEIEGYDSEDGADGDHDHDAEGDALKTSEPQFEKLAIASV